MPGGKVGRPTAPNCISDVLSNFRAGPLGSAILKHIPQSILIHTLLSGAGVFIFWLIPYACSQSRVVLNLVRVK